ncbi:hypothetical protein R1sor_018118 [Riccia sorocarpa]|uniref:Reverse transcriptase domain-containing protein n=1 Tax=Riccia sorocarpa TaxID=122646 RepID=A0ABD3I9V2_9MARC
MMTGAVAHIYAEGRISAPISIQSGVRQGCPLAPLLYAIAFIPLVHLFSEAARANQVEPALKCPKDAALDKDVGGGQQRLDSWEDRAMSLEGIVILLRTILTAIPQHVLAFLQFCQEQLRSLLRLYSDFYGEQGRTGNQSVIF